MLAVLRRRNFALLWWGALVSRLGDYTLLVGLPFYVYQRTGSTLATSGMVVAELVPEITLGSLAGVYVDRWDRRGVMIVADLLRAVVLLLLLLARSSGALWIVYLVAVAQTSIAQFFIPASGALLPTVVEERQILTANALRAMVDNVARVVGPAIGGLLLGLFGLGGVVLADAVSFLFSVGMILLVRLPKRTPIARDARGTRRSFAPTRDIATARKSGGRPGAGGPHPPCGARWSALWREWCDGLRVVRRDRVLTALFVVWSITMFSQGFMSALWVPFVRGVLHGDASLLGWIGTAQGVGGVVGGLSAGYIDATMRPRRLIVVGAVATGLFFLAMINVRTIPLLLALSAGLGLPLLWFEVTIGALLQIGTDDAYRGRVLGAYGATSSLVMLVSTALSGALGDRLGSIPLLDAAGALFVAAGGMAFVLLPRTATTGAPAAYRG